jgi:ribosomal-protein-alanine N-acetyltransferase
MQNITTNTLETRRLLLREFSEEHYPHLYRTDADPDVMRYVVPPRTPEQTRRRIDEIRAHNCSLPGLGLRMAFDKQTYSFCGMFSLKYTDAGDEIEIGCRLPTGQWRKGYATEGAAAMLRHGFHTVRLQRIVAFVFPDNHASARVLEKLGLQCEGYKQYNDSNLLYYSIGVQRFSELGSTEPYL